MTVVQLPHEWTVNCWLQVMINHNQLLLICYSRYWENGTQINQPNWWTKVNVPWYFDIADMLSDTTNFGIFGRSPLQSCWCSYVWAPWKEVCLRRWFSNSNHWLDEGGGGPMVYFSMIILRCHHWFRWTTLFSAIDSIITGVIINQRGHD